MERLNKKGQFGKNFSSISRLASQKKGQNMTLGTIILIVLGIAVLVFLIFGFSTGWNNLWDRFTNIGGTSNFDTIIQTCEVACSTSSSGAFCNEMRTVKFGEKKSSDANKQYHSPCAQEIARFSVLVRPMFRSFCKNAVLIDAPLHISRAILAVLSADSSSTITSSIFSYV